MVEALIYMALGAAFYHFCTPAAKAIYGYLKSAYNYIKSKF